MAEKKFRGIESSQEINTKQLRPDTRPLLVRARQFFQTTDGVIAAMMVVPLIALITIKIPFSGEFLLLLTWLFYKFYVDPGIDGIYETDKDGKPKKNKRGESIKKKGKVVKYDFPYRIPFFAKKFDGSYPNNKLGDGITYLGKEISTKLEIWTGNSDLRTHLLILGTTGSGKTELLLGLVYNALVQNSGFIYTDGKGDVSLFNNVFRLARYLGREDDLVTINFLTSGRDFLDKQKDRTTNTMNPFALGSSGMLIELIISLMDDAGGGGDMWKGRAIAFIAGLTRALCFLRDRGYILLDANTFIEYFELPVIEKLVWDRTITVNGNDVKIEDAIFGKVLEPLKAFILTLPGYKREAKGNQEQKTLEQHGFITMQLTRLFGDMSFTYGYLFQTSLGEVDMYDVVINRRILVVLLPALERAPDSLKMLGKLIVGAIKQMMAGCLGNRLEGSVREIVDARPTNAAVPFYVVLDEYGYYAVLGFAVAPAQARSLGFPQPLHSSVKMADGAYKVMGDILVGDRVRLPNGLSAPVRKVMEQGKLPISTVVLADGKTVDAANVHHWPVRVMSQQHKLATTIDMAEMIAEGTHVEVSKVDANGDLVWVEVKRVSYAGIMQTRCLVVDDPLHCYLTDHDIVTHNCIVFAAQDFSSLQKASKEEADATWENTNMRIVGRITSGEESETFKRIIGVAGKGKVHEMTRKEYETTAVNGRYRTIRDTNVTETRRVEYDDLAEQENGEFTFLIGKKNKDGSGGVRVIRARTFFTQVDERPREIRVNHFLKIEPPRAGSVDEDVQVMEALETGLKELLGSGKIKELFPDDPLAMARNKQPVTLLQVSSYIRESRAKHKLSLSEAVRIALVCTDRENDVQQDATLRRIAEESRRKEQESNDSELQQSVELVAAAPIEPGDETAESAAVIVNPSDPDDFAITAGPDGLPQAVPLDMDDLPVAVALVDDVTDKEGETGGEQGDTQAGGAKGDTKKGGGSGGGSSGGAALQLEPDNGIEAANNDDTGLSTAQIVGNEIKSFLDEYDFTQPVEAEASSQATSGGSKVSLLTLRSLGEGEDAVDTEQSIYLQTKLSETDMLLGIKDDVLEVKNDAKETVKALEKATSYVDGAIPEPATLDGVDIQIQALLKAAESKGNDFI